MPSWNIHLEAGERLADKLKLSGSKRKEFLLGCLLPDINNGYVNKVGIVKEHEKTHYSFDKKSSLNFYAENKDKIDQKDPLYLGCLFHLYTDGYFNYNFYRNVKHHPIGEGLTHEEKREIKHNDFWLYDTNFYHFLGIKDKKEATKLAEKASKISVIDITAEDIEDVERILVANELCHAMKGKKYLFYTKKRLDTLMDDMIDSFSHDYLGEEYA